MRQDDTWWGFFVGALIGVWLALSWVAIGSFLFKRESNLLRFCMTHSISLEQCKIPEEGK
jgi:hypothetical protein